MSKPSYTVYTKDFANMVCRRLERENKKKDKELERLRSIIKEVREYIEKHIEEEYKYDGLLYENEQKKELLEILDKENK